MTDITVVPVANGDIQDITNKVPTTGKEYWECVNSSESGDVQTSYIQVVDNSPLKTSVFYGYPQMVGGAISNVQVRIQGAGRNSGYWAAVKIVLRIKNVSGTYVDYYHDITASGGGRETLGYVLVGQDWPTQSRDFPTNPVTNAQWTWTDVYGMQVGVQMGQTNNPTQLMVTKLSWVITHSGTASSGSSNIPIGFSGFM